MRVWGVSGGGGASSTLTNTEIINMSLSCWYRITAHLQRHFNPAISSTPMSRPVLPVDRGEPQWHRRHRLQWFRQLPHWLLLRHLPDGELRVTTVAGLPASRSDQLSTGDDELLAQLTNPRPAAGGITARYQLIHLTPGCFDDRRILSDAAIWMSGPRKS